MFTLQTIRLIAVSFLVVFVTAVLPNTLLANDNLSDTEVQIDGGANWLMGPWSQVCQKGYDVVSCGTPTLLPDAILGARYRNGRRAIGGLVSVGRLYSYENMSATMWRVALEGRIYNHVGTVLDHWFTLELGVVGAHSKTDAWNYYETWVDTEHELGPEIGAGMGLDFQMGHHFAIGFSMRALWLIFFELERTDEWDDALKLYKTIWFVMGAHIRFSFPTS